MSRSSRSASLLIGCVLATCCAVTRASGAVIAGSTPASPPVYMPTSFWGFTPAIDRAFQFTLFGSAPCYAEQLQVVVYHYDGLAGDTAAFSIRADNYGIPGSLLCRFNITNIPLAADVLTSPGDSTPLLQPNTPYWLVGATPQGQVNWNLDTTARGTSAYSVFGGDWNVLTDTQLSAYAILGTAVPEPVTFLLLAGTLASVARATRRQ